MIKCTIPCNVSSYQMAEIEQSLKEFSDSVSCYGFNAALSRSDTSEGYEVHLTLLVDDDMIQAMKGAKRGPKEKITSISVDEMWALKQKGYPPEEIAALAGIGRATYFRRMAAYKEQMENQIEEEMEHENN